MRRAAAILLAVALLMGCETAVQKQTRLCKTEAKTVRTAVEAYYANHNPGVYPTNVGQLVPAYLAQAPTLVVYSSAGTSYSLIWTATCVAIPGIGTP